jgi:hypothetical protein
LIKVASPAVATSTAALARAVDVDDGLTDVRISFLDVVRDHPQ